jgi:hypothetical protein
MLKRTRFALACTVMLLSAQCLAEPFVLSHAPHPALKSIYIPILKEVYSELEIDVEFLEMSTRRGLVEANAQRVDGDVARFAEALQDFPNLITVPPALDRAEIILLCVREVDCSDNALKNAENRIVIPTETAVVRRFVATYPAKFLPVSHSLSKAQELLSLGRFEYALYVSSKLYPHHAKTDEYGLNWAVLESFPLYHVLHKSHRELADDMNPVLSRILKRYHLEKQTKK